MLNHSKPAIRKKAVIVLHGILSHHPESLDSAWPRLQARLDDEDPGVVSATVSIICELARKDPRPFLPLAPQLFQLLTTSSNNWVLIKVIKLFGALSTCEPRLGKRLLPSITSIISSTPAMSLLYECIHTIIVGDMFRDASGDGLAQTCVDKLSQFIGDTDQNLKFIALVALLKILPSHPKLVQPHWDAIAVLLQDQDASIRLHAVMLMTGLVERASFAAYCRILEDALEIQPGSGKQKSASASLQAMLERNRGGDMSKGSTEDSARYTLRARRVFIREVAMSLIISGARDHYRLVEDKASFAGLLQRLHGRVEPLVRRLIERVLLDFDLNDTTSRGLSNTSISSLAVNRIQASFEIPSHAGLGVDMSEALEDRTMVSVDTLR